MGDIPQPETIVLPHLFKSQQKHITAPLGLEEPSVQVKCNHCISHELLAYPDHSGTFLVAALWSMAISHPHTPR